MKDQSWVRGPIDQFILAKLEANGLTPSPGVDRRTLLRRMTFDLTGLPATFAEVEAFEQDRSPEAIEHAVDRLLASPLYGERRAGTGWTWRGTRTPRGTSLPKSGAIRFRIRIGTT